MARKCYLGEGGKARENRSIFLGIDDKARPLKKAYIGVNGVARPCWSGVSIPEYYGKVSGFATRYKAAAVSFDDVMLIAGGLSASNTKLATAEAINKNFEHIAVPNLAGENAGGEAIGAAAGNYAVFCTTGGRELGSVYDQNFVASYITGMPNAGYQPAAVSFNGYALMAGSSISQTYVVAVDKNLVATKLADFSKERRKYAAAQNWGYALFAGGADKANSTTICYAHVDAYDKNLVHTQAPDLSVGRMGAAGARAGSYAVFSGGGSKSPSSLNGKYMTVDAYSRKLVRTTIENLSARVYEHAGITLGECALFAGSAADCYDNRLAKVAVSASISNRCNSAAGVIGDYGLFIGGGTAYSTATNTADAFLA